MTAVLIIFSILFGLAIGSFLNVVIYRVPLHMSIAFPPSHCPVCGNKLKWYHNIPILSWVCLRGKCAFCGTRISVRYTIVEGLNAILYLLCYLAFGFNLFLPVAMLFCSALICVAFIDLEHRIIPDSLNIAIALLGIIACLFCNKIPTFEVGWLERLIGGAGAFGLTLLIHYLWIWLFKKDALGGGDIKLLGAAGLVLGWKLTLFSLILASVLGILGILVVSLFKKVDKDDEIPFAPFLAAGMIFALFLGNKIIGLYTGLLG
ncbi:MAG: prepilin peptidase [Clostridia bacterium]|nr:prepilin peptidase [Clostridia bacterium]